jgi:hypothetical protein
MPSPSLQLARPGASDTDFAELPASERRRVYQWWDALTTLNPTDITAQLKDIAARLSVSYPTARRRYDAFRASGDWRSLVDRRAIGSALRCPTHTREFRQFWGRLVEGNQRSTAAAARQLRRLWAAKEPVPGYEGHPGWPQIPRGWTNRNLARLAPSKAELLARRQGIRASAGRMAQVLTTRVGTWPGSHIQFDDVWHDHYVRHGNQVARVLEFGALDLWSACRYAWGSKPRLPRDPKTDGKKHDGLTEKEFRFFLAGVLLQGISPQGTTLVMEHGTAAVSESIERALHDATGGLIRVERGGIIGRQQSVLGLWAGRGGGNPRTKSHLESLHNLIHNELAALPGQTGKDRQHAPEHTHGIVHYQRKLLQLAANIPDHLAASLKHPLLDYHTQFLPLRDALYDLAINGRTDHDLEGWEALGRVQLEYTLAPGTDHWLTIDDVPPPSRPLLHDLVRTAPATYSRARKLSPLEVWQSGRDTLRPVPQHLIADILGADLAQTTKVQGAYITISDRDISPAPLRYEARVTQPDGTTRELPDGEKYSVFPNPYAPDHLLVCDAALRCIGIARRQIPISAAADHETTVRALGHAAHRNAQRLQPQRDRWESDAREAQALRDHNAALLQFAPPTGSGAAPRQTKPAELTAAEILLSRLPSIDDDHDPYAY